MAANYGKNPFFETKIAHLMHYYNVNLEWDLESKSQGLFKIGISFELKIFLLVLKLKSKTANLQNF